MVEGTSALTLNPPAAQPYQRPARPRPAQETRPAPRTAAPARRAQAVNPHMRLSFRAVMLFAGAMTVLLFVVYSYMELSTLSDAGRSASLELQALKKEESALNRRAEAGVSLSEAEAYAVGELGMIKPLSGQIVYIGVPAEDHAEVVRQEGFWGSVRQLFNTMGVRVAEFFD